MFAIPFFCGTVVTLDLFNLFNFDAFSVLFFVLGTSLGTFYILFLYGKYAKQIQKKAGKLIKDINLFLSVSNRFSCAVYVVKIIFLIKFFKTLYICKQISN